MTPARALLPVVQSVGSDVLSLYFDERIERDPATGCWNWLRACNEHGYANIAIKGQNYKGHRLMWTLHHMTEPPARLRICHTCDNRRCLNPAHLWLGTQHANNVDKVNKGRSGRKSPAVPANERRYIKPSMSSFPWISHRTVAEIDAELSA